MSQHGDPNEELISIKISQQINDADMLSQVKDLKEPELNVRNSQQNLENEESKKAEEPKKTPENVENVESA